MTELANAARQAKAGFEPVMPGGDKKMAASGVDSTTPQVPTHPCCLGRQACTDVFTVPPFRLGLMANRRGSK